MWSIFIFYSHITQNESGKGCLVSGLKATTMCAIKFVAKEKPSQWSFPGRYPAMNLVPLQSFSEFRGVPPLQTVPSLKEYISLGIFKLIQVCKQFFISHVIFKSSRSPQLVNYLHRQKDGEERGGGLAISVTA